MGLPKGRTNNPAGKPPGTLNKTPKAVREELTNIFFENLPQLKKDIKTMRPRDRKETIAMILPYISHRLQSTTIDAKIETRNKLANLDDDQLNTLIDQILQENETH